VVLRDVVVEVVVEVDMTGEAGSGGQLGVDSSELDPAHKV
jgi:hypothetical protein